MTPLLKVSHKIVISVIYFTPQFNLKTASSEFQPVTSVSFLQGEGKGSYRDLLENVLNETLIQFNENDEDPGIWVVDPTQPLDEALLKEAEATVGFGFQIHSGRNFMMW